MWLVFDERMLLYNWKNLKKCSPPPPEELFRKFWWNQNFSKKCIGVKKIICLLHTVSSCFIRMIGFWILCKVWTQYYDVYSTKTSMDTTLRIINAYELLIFGKMLCELENTDRLGLYPRCHTLTLVLRVLWWAYSIAVTYRDDHCSKASPFEVVRYGLKIVRYCSVSAFAVRWSGLSQHSDLKSQICKFNHFYR